MTVREEGFDVWTDFNDIDDTGHVTTYADFVQPGHGPYGPGAHVTAGDGEGNRCPATVAETDGWRIVLKLDLDRFHPAGGPR